MSALEASDHSHSGLLTDATISSLQLHHQPFTQARENVAANGNSDSSATAPFSDAVTEEQLADIKQALITGDDLLLILGENGSGKTTLLQQLDANSGLRIQCFPVSGSERFSTLNLFAGMLEAFQINPPDTLKGVLDELIPCLQSMVGRNTLSVIVLDDAQAVNHGELTQLLSGMLYMNSQDETLMRVALSATGDFEDLIPDLLPEGADLPYSSLTIEGFSPQRAAAYLDYRLQQAGFDQEFPFTDRDMASLVDHSAGRPAELHALTADVLNEKFGRFDDVEATDLMTPNGTGFLQSRKSKLLLGALATLLILGGALMFMPSPDDVNPQPANERLVVTQQSEAVQTQAPILTPVNPAQEAPDTSQSNADQLADSLANNTSTSTASPTDEVSEQENPVPTTQVDTNETNASTTTQTVPADSATTDNNSQAAASTTSDNNDSVTDNTRDASDDASAEADAMDNSNTVAAPNEAPTQTEEVPANTQQAPASGTTEPDTSGAPAEPTEEEPAEAEQAESVPDVVVTDEASSDTDDLADILESPSWILVQDENLFTIQMSASTELESVQNFLRRNPLPAPNSVFSFERNGDIWYALVHGIFPTVADAQRAVEQMPTAAQRDQPWIRSIARIKGIYREE